MTFTTLDDGSLAYCDAEIEDVMNQTLVWKGGPVAYPMPTEHMVRIGNRWYRVYVARCGTRYIDRLGKRRPILRDLK